MNIGISGYRNADPGASIAKVQILFIQSQLFCRLTLVQV
jgi:hypothetical protein